MPSRHHVFRLALVVYGLLGPARAALTQEPRFTRADTLRGTVGPERAWWDVHHYDLSVRVNPADSTISGSNAIGYLVIGPKRPMQIDLMMPLEVDSIVQAGRPLPYRREGNAFLVDLPGEQAPGSRHTVTVFYHGRPHVAENPPWEGGFVWTRGPSGTPWVATANQGVGASIWWPNKDHQSDEPDSLRVSVRVPEPMLDVSNGRLEGREDHPDGTTTFRWVVKSPINNYNVTINAGNYVQFGERFQGAQGPLDLDYWVLAPNLERARRQFEQVPPMLRCFEDWFGPYPFYEDGFKLVETPHLGMEHQSAVAYGNQYRNGYLGMDLSGTGWGLRFDFIIVHESGHEWFGNSITTADIADMWVHEGFTAYSENLYVECQFGTEAGAAYVIGTRGQIANDRPVIGVYGVNHEGSDDMYYKGANLLHTLRQLVGDDARWKDILKGMNATFRHQVVTSAQVEAFVAERSGLDLAPVFDQYLRHTHPPVLEYSLDGDTLRYRWRAEAEGFAMPVLVNVDGDEQRWIKPRTGEWQTLELDDPDGFGVDEDFYVDVERVPPDRGSR